MNDGFKKTKIKRCPFCGSEAHVEAYAGVFDDSYTVVCNDDNCRGGLRHADLSSGLHNRELAIAKWNRRENKKWTSKKK